MDNLLGYIKASHTFAVIKGLMFFVMIKLQKEKQ